MTDKFNNFMDGLEMTYSQKNTIASLLVSSLTLVIYLVSMLRMVQTDSFVAENVFRLWVWIIGITIVGIILMTILAHIFSAVVQAIQTQEEPEVDSVEDERDELIDLKGKRAAHALSSLGVFAAMLAFVFTKDGLVLFSLLILAGILSQLAGDVSRLVLYKRGY